MNYNFTGLFKEQGVDKQKFFEVVNIELIIRLD